MGGGTGGAVLVHVERTMPRRRDRWPSLASTGGWSRHLKRPRLDRLCCRGRQGSSV